jgi:hypothetical protein
MKQGIQTDFPEPNIKEYGCYFLDILRFVELETGMDFSVDAIINIYKSAVSEKILKKDCFILKPLELYKQVGGKEQYKELATAKFPPHKLFTDTYIICQKKPMYTHFVLSHKDVIWDSLDPNRPGAIGYKPDSYRVFV